MRERKDRRLRRGIQWLLQQLRAIPHTEMLTVPVTALEQLIHELRRARFGRSAERVDPGQLVLALGATPPPPLASNQTPAPRGRKPQVACRAAPQPRPPAGASRADRE